MSIKALQEHTYWSRYARYNAAEKRRETWGEAVNRVKEMHLRRYPQVREEIDWAFEQVHKKRVLGSQRALQFGGTPIEAKHARIYNCFRENTPFITSDGVRTFADYSDGDKVMVLTHAGNWMPGIVRSYGEQSLNRVQITRGRAQHEVYVTADHRWILKGGTETTSLKEGDRLAFGPEVFNDFVYEKAEPDERLYWAYGYTYGDGTKVKDGNGVHKYSMVRLCGEEVKYLSRFEELGFSNSTSLSLKGDVMVYTGKYLKTLPDPVEDSPRLIRAFVRGYLDADGAKNSNNRDEAKTPSPTPYDSIQATGKEVISFIRTCFPIAGVYIVSEEDLTDQVTNYGPRGDQTIRFRIINGFGKCAPSFTVDAIEEDVAFENVWCLEVEDDRSFVLPFGLPTGNCTVSYCDRPRFFQEAFWLLLCGCGVGFSVQKHHIAKLPDFTDLIRLGDDGKVAFHDTATYKIPDSIEGWSDALGVLLASYMPHPEFDNQGVYVKFDYSEIRKAGSPLSSGVGKAPGPEPLRRSIEMIRDLLDARICMGYKRLRPIDAYDIVMHASDAVLSGGVRRSATICLFSPDDEEMATAKTGDWFITNPQRARSNNSALLLRNSTTKEQFKKLMESVKQFGEPGFVWSDSTELVVNPCVEIGMWPTHPRTGESGWQFCNLCEINGRKIKSKEDFAVAARAAAIIGTCQAGYTDFSYLGQVTKEIVEEEALLGVSITGMMDNPDVIFDPKIQREMAKLVLDVNAVLAEKIGIKPCARGTCVKPAGTTSCILGCASGIHPHHATRYFRRIQGNYMEAPLQHFKKFNPLAVERSVHSANGTDEVVTFCIEVPPGAKTKNQIDALTLLKYVKLTQQNWVAAGKRSERCAQEWLSHNVSNTINVQPDEWDAVSDFIYNNRQHFAGIALLPQSGDLDYEQAPMTTVHTAAEIVKMYGEGSLFASGLIVDGLRIFNGLWDACNHILGFKSLGEQPVMPEVKEGDPVQFSKYTEWVEMNAIWQYRHDWLRRAKQFSTRYFGGDDRKMTYCLKEVHNWKLWQDLCREYKDVDYSTMMEEEDNTKLQQEWACSGGLCHIL
jgi:ribonucleoside-diphosphate reductase alpha chain